MVQCSSNYSLVQLTGFLNTPRVYQTLVGSMIIGDELDRENHGSISRNCDREGFKSLDDIIDLDGWNHLIPDDIIDPRGLKPLDTRIDPQTGLNRW